MTRVEGLLAMVALIACGAVWGFGMRLLWRDHREITDANARRERHLREQLRREASQ